jgi:hypothetical protein
MALIGKRKKRNIRFANPLDELLLVEIVDVAIGVDVMGNTRTMTMDRKTYNRRKNDIKMRVIQILKPAGVMPNAIKPATPQEVKALAKAQDKAEREREMLESCDMEDPEDDLDIIGSMMSKDDDDMPVESVEPKKALTPAQKRALTLQRKKLSERKRILEADDSELTDEELDLKVQYLGEEELKQMEAGLGK